MAVVAGLVALVLASVIIVRTGPATGYEISLYDAYPPHFWFFLFLIISCGILLMVDGSIHKRRPDFWKVGFLFVLSGNLIVLALPFLRGYAFYGTSDAISHLGFARDILLSGHIGESNFYPALHILAGTVSSILGVDLEVVVMLFPPLFYVVFCVGLVLLGRLEAGNLRRASLAIVFGMVFLNPTYSAQFYAIGISFLLIPLVLHLYKKRLKKPTAENSVLFLIVSLFLVFVHPATALILVALLVLDATLKRISAERGQRVESTHWRAYPSIIIILATLFLWFSSFALFEGRVVVVAEWLGGEFVPYMQTYGTAVSKAGLTMFETFALLFKSYGQHILYTISALVAIGILVRKSQSLRHVLRTEETFYALYFVFFGAITLLFLLGGSGAFGYPLRYSIPAFQGSAILSGLVFQRSILHREGRKRQAEVERSRQTADRVPLFFVIAMLVISSGVGMFNAHHSPIVGTANSQITSAEILGGEWLGEKGGSSFRIVIVGSQLGWRLQHAVHGFEMGNQIGFSQATPHFGYDSNESENFTLDYDSFLVVTVFDRRFYSDLYPTEGSFTMDDFAGLDHDPNLSNIYDDGDVQAYANLRHP